METDKRNLTNLLHQALHDPLATEQIFLENETSANILVERSLFVSACVLLVLWLLNMVGVLAVRQQYVLQIFLAGIIEFLIPAIICHIFHGKRKWIKYMLLAGVVISCAYLDSVLTFSAPLLIIFPVLFSCRYYSCAFTILASALTSFAFLLSSYCGATFNFGNPDMNFAANDKQEYIRNVMTQSFFPKWVVFLVVTALCYEIARCGRELVLKQDIVSKKNARVDAELEMASRIQAQALPTSTGLPGNPYREIDLAAKMVPAKVVGGDFYDFFYPDPTHLAIIIADVADKGIAASLYMMMSKTFLDTHLSVSLSPSAVLEEVNKQLHERSPKGMFVTVWLGVLDLRTGEMATSNAGHEYPVIKRKDGAFELIKDKHGFVLGGLKNTRFKEQIMQLNEGDILLVYTDGVPEATNKDGQMYGLDRMLDSLNGYTPSSMSDLVNHLKSDIDQFAKGVSQFDDTTIMALRMGARLGVDSNPEALQVKPVISELERIQEYISGLIDPAAEESKNLMKIHIAADEIFSNIVNHSDATFVKVQGQVIDNEMRLTFFDDGVPFDPLKQEAPDLVAEASKRKIGGLGIFITCKTMDDVAYQYENNMNQLTITKKL